jgi:hypothetical protein
MAKEVLNSFVKFVEEDVLPDLEVHATAENGEPLARLSWLATYSSSARQPPTSKV